MHLEWLLLAPAFCVEEPLVGCARLQHMQHVRPSRCQQTFSTEGINHDGSCRHSVVHNSNRATAVSAGPVVTKP